jgi:DNA-(apurinic or apyrimidinic site) lyase
MEIEQFIQKYDIKKIKNLEQNDPQFLALKNARNKIKNKDKNLFLYLTIQCSLVGYQIAWSWESRWWEFWEKITQDRQILQNLRNQKKCNSSRWYSFLTSSKYNKRIYNIKTNRIKKFNQILIEENNFSNFWNKLQKLNTILATTMKSKKDNKTITFAVKMFGYAHEVISWKEIIYPMNISIPIDSRLKKIYTTNYPIRGKDQLAGRGVQNKEIETYFQKLSETHKIPPLHLDSILRLDYWNKFFKK